MKSCNKRRLVKNVGESIFVIAMLLFAIGAQHAEAALIARPATSLGLVGHWTFDDRTGSTATDHSGYENHGSLSGTGGPTWISGKRGGALNFAGQDTNNNQTVTVPVSSTNPELNIMGDVTISAWIRPSSSYFDTAQAVIRVGQGADLVYSMFYDPVNRRPYFHWYNGSFSSVNGAVNSAPLDIWSHVTIVRSGTTLNFYVNGVFTNSVSVTAPTVGAVQLSIGRTNGVGVPQDFSGDIDDVRIYDRALSASEVSAVASMGQTTRVLAPSSGLVGHWTFNEGAGTRSDDMTGNGNHANFTGGMTWTQGKRAGAAASSDGLADYVLIPGTGSLQDVTDDGNSYSLAVWFKPSGLPQNINDGYIFYRPGFHNGIYYRKLDGEFRVIQWYSDNTGVGVNNSGIRAETGRWYHLVMTVDEVNNQLRFYIDGRQVGTTANITKPLRDYGSGSYAILSHAGNNYEAFGAVDDARIYNRVLAADEVNALYRATEAVLNAPQDGQVAEGLVGFWTFNGKDFGSTVADVSGNGNHGYVIGAATSTVKSIGKVGQAITFDGSDDHVRVPYSASLAPTDAISFGGWFKTRNKNASQKFISKTEVGGYALVINEGIGGCSATSICGLVRANTPSANYYGVGYDRSNITNDQWHHVMTTYDGSAVRLYFDGELVGTNSSPSGAIPYSVNNPFCIGAEATGSACTGGQYTPGDLDEVRVYNRAITAQEVKRLYLMGK